MGAICIDSYGRVAAGRTDTSLRCYKLYVMYYVRSVVCVGVVVGLKDIQIPLELLLVYLVRPLH